LETARINAERDQRETERRQQQALIRQIEAQRANEQAQQAQQQAEQQRQTVATDARDEVVRFYEENARFLDQSLPPALFRSRLAMRFPATSTSSPLWQTAQDMIAEMLPLITDGRERQRAVDQQYQRRNDRVRMIRLQIARLDQQIESLTTSPTADPEVVALEVRSLESEICTLREEAQFIEESAPEGVS
jgi:hypothetical protein